MRKKMGELLAICNILSIFAKFFTSKNYYNHEKTLSYFGRIHIRGYNMGPKWGRTDYPCREDYQC